MNTQECSSCAGTGFQPTESYGLIACPDCQYTPDRPCAGRGAQCQPAVMTCVRVWRLNRIRVGWWFERCSGPDYLDCAANGLCDEHFSSCPNCGADVSLLWSDTCHDCRKPFEGLPVECLDCHVQTVAIDAPGWGYYCHHCREERKEHPSWYV